MAKYQVKKIEVKHGVFLAVEFESGMWYAENGIIYLDVNNPNTKEKSGYGIRCSIERSDVCASQTRNVPEEVKKLLNEGVFYVKKALDVRKQINSLENELYEVGQSIMAIPAKITNAKGLLTKDEFANCVKSELIKRGQVLEINNWRVCCTNAALVIARDDYIEKYFRRGSFVYEEYDGTMLIAADAEKDKSYQSYLKKHRRTLNTKYPLRDWLSLGDKDWLYYCAEYRVDIKKPLTREYAKELCDKFCA